MRAWLDRCEKIRARLLHLRETEEKAKGLEAKVEAHREEVLAELAEMGEPVESKQVATLAAVLDRADEVHESLTAAAAEVSDLERRKRELETQQEEASRELGVEQSRLATWEKEWAAALGPLGLPADTTPGQARDFLATAAEIRRLLTESERYGQRIEAIDRDAGDFETRLRAILAEVAPDLRGRTWRKPSPTSASAWTTP